MAQKRSNCSDEEGGNTKSPSSAPCVRWSFTLNYDKKEDTTQEECVVLSVPLIDKLKEFTKLYRISLECESRYHLQGYLEFRKKLRFGQVKMILGNTAHIEKCKGDKIDNMIYVSKAPLETWSWDLKDEKKKKVVEPYTADDLGLITEDMLFEWQKEVIQIIRQKPNKRTIYWYWSKKGGVGKTEFIKYLAFYEKAQFVQGAKKDVMNSIVGNDKKISVKEKLGQKPIIIFGFARTVEDYVSYDSIESLKDGLIFNSKYESKFEMIPTPHIFIFCNFPPDLSSMSIDRWVVKQIDKDEDENDTECSISSADRYEKKLVSKRSPAHA